MNESSTCRSEASSGPTDGSSNSPTHAARSLICMRHASAIERPRIFEERAAALSRVPSQSGQVVKATARSTNSRMCGCSAARSLDSIDFWIRSTRPS